jgi:hypothetical protein
MAERVMRGADDEKSSTWRNNEFVSAVGVFMPESIAVYKKIRTIPYEGRILRVREAVRSLKILQPLKHLEEVRVVDYRLR